MLGFWPSDAVLITVQAGLVAGSRVRTPELLLRLEHRMRASSWSAAWAAILPVSLGGTIALLAVAPGAAELYTWLALIAVPLLAVLALRDLPGGTITAVAVAGALFVVAWAVPGLPGQGAAVALTALSCLTLAALLGELVPAWALKTGVVVMAALDAVLVFGQLLQGPNDHLNSAAPVPGSGLPQLQVAVFGSVLLGYGDLFVAAVFGYLLSRRLRSGAGSPAPIVAAVATLTCSAIFDLLFLVVDTLPATVPVAIVLLAYEATAFR